MNINKEREQDKFASREIRYALMRIARFTCWIFWPIGMFVMVWGFAMFLAALCDGPCIWIGGPGEVGRWFLLIGPVVMATGIGVWCVSLSMTVPYQMESRSAEARATRCSCCGGELDYPASTFPACLECKASFPLRFSVMMAILFSSWITFLNILLIIIGFIIAAA